jgi:hypothetical protein
MRGNNIHASGILTEINLNKDRDTVLCKGEDWIGYLKRRVYPFDPDAYVNDRDWVRWPKQWGQGLTAGVDVRIIVEDLMEAMINGRDMTDPTSTGIADSDTPGNFIDGTLYTPPFILANPNSGVMARHRILPGDERSIYDHIAALSESSTGFEFDILPHNLEFKMYFPDRDNGIASYDFTKFDHITEFDWTNSGPEATVSTIYGSGSGLKAGIIRTFKKSLEQFRWTDKTANVGDVASMALLRKIADSEKFQDRFPRKKLGLAIHDPEQLVNLGMPNFWTGGRPRALVGDRIRATHDFGFHLVDAYYRVMAIRIAVDEHGNETIRFDLEMINDPDPNNYGTGGGGLETNAM